MSRSVSHDAELGLLQQRLGPWYSLAPHRNHATPLYQLCSQLIDHTIDSSLARVFAQGIAQTAQALAAHFPENIFADIDFLAAALLAQTQAHSQSADSELNRHQVPRDLAELFDRITALIRGQNWYRVKVGSYPSKDAAANARKKLASSLGTRDLMITEAP